MDESEYIKRLEGVGWDLVEALQDRLTWEHGRFKGDLQSSIEFNITSDLKLQIIMEDYGEYIEFGTPNPTTPNEILDWVNKKIMPNLRSKPKTQKNALQIATSLADHISTYGPRPFPFIRMTMTQDLPKILASNGL